MGKLDKTKPMEYDARKNANRFSFYLIDRKGTEKKVVYSNAKPQGFETADTIVIIGFMNKEEFNARQLLQKCPSKYDTKKVSEKFGVQKY